MGLKEKKTNPFIKIHVGKDIEVKSAQVQSVGKDTQYVIHYKHGTRNGIFHESGNSDNTIVYKHFYE